MTPEIAVGAVVVDGGRLLLIQRGRPPHAGEWSLPGGRVEGGESLAVAVEREVAEETGLQVRCGPLVGWVERIGPEHHYVILDFLAGLVGDDDVDAPLSAGDDASDAAWVALDDVRGHAGLVPGLADFLTEHGVIS